MIKKNKDIFTQFFLNLPLILLCLFVISNYFTPLYYLGESFARLPFILAATLGCICIIRILFKGKDILYISKPIFLIAVILIFSFIFSYFVSIDKNHSKLVFADFAKGIILFILITQIIATKRDLYIFIFVVVLCSFGMAYKLVNFPSWHYGRAFLLGSSLTGNPNGMSAVFVYSIPFALSLLLIFKSNILRLCLIYFVFIMLLGIVEARSRGGFLSIVASLTSFLLIIKMNRDRLIFFLFSFVLCSVFFIRYVPNDYIWRMQEIIHQDSDSTGSINERLEAMQITYNYTFNNLFSEFGLGNHSYYIVEKKESINISTSNEDIFRGSYLVHNSYLQFGADMGLIPLLFYISFIISLFITLRKSFKLLREQNITTDFNDFRKIGIGLSVSLIGYLTGSFFLPWAYDFFLFYISGIIVSFNKVVTLKYIFK